MPLIGSWVDGNAFCAKSLTIDGKLLYIGNVSPAGIAQGTHLVDVDT
jgi:hypothetical protein